MMIVSTTGLATAKSLSDHAFFKLIKTTSHYSVFVGKNNDNDSQLVDAG